MKPSISSDPSTVAPVPVPRPHHRDVVQADGVQFHAQAAHALPVAQPKHGGAAAEAETAEICAAGHAGGQRELFHNRAVGYGGLHQQGGSAVSESDA